MKLWHKLGATVVLSGLAAAVTPQFAAAQSVIKIDGSSTVFPIAEAVAEEFQITQARQGPRHRRHRRHRRRLQALLPRRNRHLERLASDPEGRDGSVPRGGHQVHRAAGRVRRADRRRQSAEHLGQVADRRRPQEDVGAGRAEPRHEVEPGPLRVAGAAADAVRPGRRLRHVRLLHRSRERQGEGEPRRLHRERRRQRARAGRGEQQERARLLRLRVLRRPQGQDARRADHQPEGHRRSARASRR